MEGEEERIEKWTQILGIEIVAKSIGRDHTRRIEGVDLWNAFGVQKSPVMINPAISEFGVLNKKWTATLFGCTIGDTWSWPGFSPVDKSEEAVINDIVGDSTLMAERFFGRAKVTMGNIKAGHTYNRLIFICT